MAINKVTEEQQYRSDMQEISQFLASHGITSKIVEIKKSHDSSETKRVYNATLDDESEMIFEVSCGRCNRRRK